MKRLPPYLPVQRGNVRIFNHQALNALLLYGGERMQMAGLARLFWQVPSSSLEIRQGDV